MSEAEPHEPTGTVQFDLRSLLWLTVTISLALAFLRPLGAEIVLRGVVISGVAAILGLLVGLLRKRVRDTLYWSVLGALFAFMSAVGFILPHWSACLAWAAVGAISGTAIGWVEDRHPVRAILVGGLSAICTFGLYAIVMYFYFRQGTFMTFDLICSVLAGTLFGALVVVLRWLEKVSPLRRDVMATLLMFFVVIGNHLARLLDA